MVRKGCLMEVMRHRSKARDICLVIIGTFLMACTINLVYDPMNMVTGGVTGLAIAIKDMAERLFKFALPIWVTNIVLNIPLFVTSYLILDKKNIKMTLFATVMLSAFIYVIPEYTLFEHDYLLASVVGGVAGGVGTGFVFATGATTGGTDLLCMIIHQKKKYYSIPKLLIVVDSLVVITGVLVFGVNPSLYAIIAVYVVAKVSDGILEGMKFAKMAYIISDRHEDIAKEIMVDVGRGVTGIRCKGMYSCTEKNLILCLVSRKEIVQIIDIVNALDPKAFMIISDAREVVGEGFMPN